MSNTYKIPIKDTTRELVWEHAIDSLTTSRELSRVLNKYYIKKLWEYAFDDYLIKYNIVENYDNLYLHDWLSFSDTIYQNKKPNELKVAFFCGPEPENDVEHLLRLGVRIENIYAFESDKGTFKQAVDSLRDNYPTLKIYNGKIENFLLSNFIVFDIIYLDFTESIISAFKSLCTILDKNGLSNLSILAVNTCFPDKNEENIDFLTNYFFYQSCFEYSVFFGKEKGETNEGRFIESANCYGYDYHKTRESIEKNFEEAYSAFQTSFILNYANHIKPFISVLNNSITKKRLFNIERNEMDKLISDFKKKEEIYIQPESYSLFHFFNSHNKDSWNTFFSEKGSEKFSRNDIATLMYAFLDSQYENYSSLLSDALQSALPKINSNLLGKNRSVFCDIPMIHIWLEQAINQLGYPYHMNSANHKRYSYTSKTRKMCLDIFTFDQCRALYDWLPMIEYYGDDLSISERQMISRICIDAIGKHSLHILERQYYGSAIVGINEHNWAKNHYIKDRIDLNDKLSF
jgi:hypothetical protein